MRNILFVVGSVRRDSFNRQLSVIAKTSIEDWAKVSYLDPSSVPFMNQDLEFRTPPMVDAARRSVMAADAVWFFTPEYNHSIPGVLKNLVDWLSRPLDMADPERRSALTGKKTIISGVGGGNRTEFSRTQLSDVLSFTGMELIDGIGRGFSLDRRAFTENVWEPDASVVNDIKEQAELLRSSLE